MAMRRTNSKRAVLAVAVPIGIAGAVLLIMIAGVVIVSLAAGLGDDASWTRLGNVGEAFGVLESLLSGLAFLALVTTLWIQFAELRLQRTELQLQRDALERSSAELRRAADTGMRTLHLDLVRLSMDDAALAQVWPGTATLDETRRREYIYANLIFQQFAYSTQLADHADEEICQAVRHLFSSPVIRSYWDFSRAERETLRTLTPPAYARVERLADEVWQRLQRETAEPDRPMPPE
jgi:hypothetical protein